MKTIDWQLASECLRVLAHPERLKVIHLLLAEELSVGDLAERCGLAQSVMSEHLTLLKRQGMLSSRKEGRRVFYFVQEPSLTSIINCIEKRFTS